MTEPSQDSETPPRLVRIVRGCGTLVIVVFCMQMTFLSAVEYRELTRLAELQTRAASWPEAHAEVVRTDIEQHRESRFRRSYQPVVVYIYRTPQGPCNGSAVRLDRGSRKSSAAEAQAFLDDYPVGSSITVRYDPDETSASVIDASAPDWDNVRRHRDILWAFAAGWVLWLAFQVRRLVRRLRGTSETDPDTESTSSPNVDKPK